MADRIGRVYLRAWDGRWYFKFNGKPVRIGERGATAEEAEKAKAAYVEKAYLAPDSSTEPLDNEETGKILLAYLEHGTKKIDPRHRQNKKRVIERFNERFGTVPYSELKMKKVKNWIEEQPTWGVGGRKGASMALKAAFAYWCEEERLSSNVLAFLRLDNPQPRTEQFVVGRNIYERLREQSEGWLRDILDFLWLTGARPSECLEATADEYVPALSAIVKKRHKTAWKGKKREIKLGPAAKSLVERLVAQYPTGRLFRGVKGGNITPSYLHCCLRMLCYRIGMTVEEAKWVIPYSFRHAFACRALSEARMSLRDVASLMGHSRVKTLEANYGHTLAALAGMENKLAAVE